MHFHARCGDCALCQRERNLDAAEELTTYIREENPELRRRVFLSVPGEGLQAGRGIEETEAAFQAQVDPFREMVDELMWQLQTRKGERVEYVGGVEPLQNGNPHAHLLVDQYIDATWLTYAWRDCGDDPDRGGHSSIRLAEGDPADIADYIVGFLDQGVTLSNL